MGVTAGVVLRAPDAANEAGAKRAGLPVIISARRANPFQRTLLLEPGVVVPWGLVAEGLALLARWDIAVPLAGGLARDEGNAGERALTERVVRDLRVPARACEMLFLAQNAMTNALLDVWEQEMMAGSNARLAFLRAIYRVKPTCCDLPTLWLATPGARASVAPGAALRPSLAAPQPTKSGLMRVEIAPGRFIRCAPGKEQELIARYREHSMCRHDRRGG